MRIVGLRVLQRQFLDGPTEAWRPACTWCGSNEATDNLT